MAEVFSSDVLLESNKITASINNQFITTRSLRSGGGNGGDDRQRSFICNLCPPPSHRRHDKLSPIVFASQIQLDEHMNSHSGDRPYVCQICDKSFGLRSVLWNHKRIHSNERPFNCDLCTKTFKWKNSLKIHLEIHERDTNRGLNLTKISLASASETKEIDGYGHKLRKTSKTPIIFRQKETYRRRIEKSANNNIVKKKKQHRKKKKSTRKSIDRRTVKINKLENSNNETSFVDPAVAQYLIPRNEIPPMDITDLLIFDCEDDQKKYEQYFKIETNIENSQEDADRNDMAIDMTTKKKSTTTMFNDAEEEISHEIIDQGIQPITPILIDQHIDFVEEYEKATSSIYSELIYLKAISSNDMTLTGVNDDVLTTPIIECMNRSFYQEIPFSMW